ncbi:MAG: hypothetical protein AB7P03_23505 [Kofleriaceae bacterium]
MPISATGEIELFPLRAQSPELARTLMLLTAALHTFEHVTEEAD